MSGFGKSLLAVSALALTACVEATPPGDDPGIISQTRALAARHDRLFGQVCSGLLNESSLANTVARAQQRGLSEKTESRLRRLVIGTVGFTEVTQYSSSEQPFFVIVGDGIPSASAYTKVEGAKMCSVMVKPDVVQEGYLGFYNDALDQFLTARAAAAPNTAQGFLSDLAFHGPGAAEFTTQEDPPGMRLNVAY